MRRTRKTVNLGDGRMADKVTDAIQCITTIPTESLLVKVQEGWVFLGGELQSRHQKVFVEAMVRELEGVTGVTNLIAVEANPVSLN